MTLVDELAKFSDDASRALGNSSAEEIVVIHQLLPARTGSRKVECPA
jgi:hypothetical protein